MPRLSTLGKLELRGMPFHREKPLLLLAYLCLNGSQGPHGRRGLARLFWPGASNPMNSLSVAAAQLRKVVPHALHATETQISADLACDALDFKKAALNHDVAAATALYAGPFLHGLTLDDLGEELEEWVMATREELAGLHRALLVHEAHARLPSAPAEAGALAAQAYALAGAAPLTPEHLRELHGLLSAAAHPDRARLEREAAELGLTLHSAAPRAPTLPLTPLLGRQSELGRLASLPPGDTLWLRGATGLGKTALLRALAARGGTLLSGRGGQPYLTLAPLVQGQGQADPPGDERAWLEVLTRHSSPLLVDDWEAADPDSRRALLALARSKAGGPLIIASRERPPATLTELTLRPLTQADLGGVSAEAWARSGGLPSLLSAETDTALAEAYANLLGPLSPRTRQLLACLAVQPAPNRQATRAALNLSAEDMAEQLETLTRACLLEDARPTAPAAARAWVGTQPSLETEVLTLLAPHLEGGDALPLYFRIHELTGSSDLPGFQAALEGQVRTLLDAGRDHEAEALLGLHALSEMNMLLHGRALDALGRYPEAIKRLDTLERTPLVEAYRGRVLFRLGRVTEAEQAAQEALKGDLEARARGHGLRGMLALTKRDYQQAADSYERAAGLFQLRGDVIGRLNALCTQAVAMMELNRDAGPLIETILDSSQGVEHPLTLINIGWLFDRTKQPEHALKMARRAAHNAEARQQDSVAALAWNNVGAFLQKSGQRGEAEQAYQKAIGYARKSGDVRRLALALGNLAELTQSVPLIEEVIVLLRDAGQGDGAAYFEALRQSFMARSEEG